MADWDSALWESPCGVILVLLYPWVQLRCAATEVVLLVQFLKLNRIASFISKKNRIASNYISKMDGGHVSGKLFFLQIFILCIWFSESGHNVRPKLLNDIELICFVRGHLCHVWHEARMARL